MASRSLGTLTLDLVAKIGGFTGPLTQAERDLKKRAMAIERGVKRIGTAAGLIVAAMATATAAGVKSAIDYADQLNDMNQRLGVSAEALSGWAYAAKQSGTDIDALGTGLKKLAKNMAEALDPKSSQGRMFEALGISITDSAGKLRDVEDVLPEVASAFKSLDNATLESAMAMELFGKSGTDLIEFLNLGGDGIEKMRDRARELGIELDGATLQAADAFNDTLGDMKVSVDALWAQIAADLLPDLVRLAQSFQQLIADGNRAGSTAETLADGLRIVGTFAASSVSLISSLTNIVGGFVQEAWGFYKVIAGILSLDMSTIKSGWGTMQGGGAKIQAGAGRLVNPHGPNALFKPGQQFAQYNGPLLADSSMPKIDEGRVQRAFMPAPKAGSKARAAKGGKSDAERDADQLKASYDRMNSSLAEQIAMFGKVTEEARVRYDVENGELMKLLPAQKEILIAQARKIDMMRDEADVAKALDEAKKRAEESYDAVISNLKEEMEQLGKTAEAQSLYNAIKAAGTNLTEEQIRSITDLNSKLFEQGEAMDASIAIQDAWRSGLSDAITDVVTGAKSMKDAFKDFFDSFAQMVTKMLADRLIKNLFGEMGSSGGGSQGGWLSALAGIFGGGKAAGGTVSSGKMYRVNENGPEMLSFGNRDYLMMGAGGGNITPNHKLGGRGGTVNQTFVVQGDPNRRTREQQARLAGREARRAVARA